MTEKKKSGAAMHIIGAVLCVVFGFFLVCNIVIIVKGTLHPETPPTVLGVAPMVVLSGSMSGTAEDHIEVGDLIFTKQADIDELQVGDVVAFMDGSIVVTHRIVRALNAVKTKPKLMISASAVGYYPPEVEADEYTRTRGEGFLSDLCYAWEKEAKRCPEPTRLVITRFGVVLSPDGGAMQQMLRPLQATKVATAIGPGTQSFPWIALHDLCRAMEFLIAHEETRGVYNLVAPQQISQYSFTREMGKAYQAWTTIIAPQRAFRIFYGEAASFLTAGQKVRPTRLTEAGFRFSIPTVECLFKGTDHTTVSSLDLNRYMGLWYEIARYENRFEHGLVDVTATYTLRPDGTIRVENRGCKRNSPYDICKTANGHAKIPDPTQPGKLKVSFFLSFYSDYYVLELDEENYNYALVGSSTDKYLWILSRAPQLPEEIKKKLVTAAERRGYDTNRLQWIEQF